MDAEKEALISTRRQTVEDIEAQLTRARRQLQEAEAAEVGKLPNIRGGFYHIHSASYECGIAYWQKVSIYDKTNAGEYQPCRKLVNHAGECGFEDNTAF